MQAVVDRAWWFDTVLSPLTLCRSSGVGPLNLVLRQNTKEAPRE